MENFTIYIKVNSPKIIHNENKFWLQLQNVSTYIVNRKKLNVKSIDIKFGQTNDNFIKNITTIKLTYNLKKL